MASISIGKAWEDSVAFIARESTLLLPVALLFVALPGVILQEMVPPQLTQWMVTQPRTMPPPVDASFWLALVITMIVIWFGSLTLFALALRPGISVGEALRLSVARLPVLIGTALLLIGLFGAVVVAGAVLVAILGFLSQAAAALLVGLLMLVLGVLLIFASVRLLLLNPVVIDGTLGVAASIRHAWALTRGHFWRLLAFLLLLTLLSGIASTAAQAVIGALAGLAAGPDAARLAGGIAGALVSTVVQLYLLVMLARLYRQAEGLNGPERV
jgi:hypothetical protein